MALLVIASLYASSIGNPFTTGSIFLFFALSCMPFLVYICFAPGLTFQKVIINNEGIEIFFFKKSIKKIDWDMILSIEKTCHMKNPALKIELPNEEEMYLDNRKSIREAIQFYSGKQIKH